MRASRLLGSVLLAGALVAVLTGVLVGAAGSHAAASKRAGTIAFIRVGPGPDYMGQLFSVRADGSGLRPVTPRDKSVFSYAWSPDGRLIAYIDQQTLSLWLVRPDGTGHRRLLPTTSLGLSWSPDSKAIAIVTPDPRVNPRKAACAKLALYIIPIGGGTPVLVSPPRRGIGCGVAWSPRGGEIAYGDGGEVLGVISRNGGRPRLLLTSSGVGAPQWSPDGTKLAAPTVIHLGQLAPTATTGSPSSTRTEAIPMSSPTMPTPSTPSPGRPTAGRSSTADRPAGHLRDRRGRARQPPRHPRLAPPGRMGCPRLVTRRTLDRLRHRPDRQRRPLRDRRRRPQQASTHKLSRERDRSLLATSPLAREGVRGVVDETNRLLDLYDEQLRAHVPEPLPTGGNHRARGPHRPHLWVR